MKRTTNILIAVMALACLFAMAPNAEAKPGFFVAQGCTGCHYDDTETCNGCHFHGGHSSKGSADNGVVGTTDSPSYAPGDSISVTVEGGWMPYPNAWVRANLYDENGDLVDRSTGPDGPNGTGGGDDFPITLFGTAPATPGTYQWEVSWYGNAFDTQAPSGPDWVPGVGYPSGHGEEFVLTNSFEVTAACIDGDGDGVYAPGSGCGDDCDDTNPFVYPGAGEDCRDGLDNDCDGLVDTQDPDAVNCPVVCTDADDDTYNVEGGECGAVDCDDTNPAINPGAIEICTDGIDNNCNNLIDDADPNPVGCGPNCTDGDLDGFFLEGGECGPADCNDIDPAINPGATEICTDGIDNNCNNLVDNADPNPVGCSTNCDDGDGDGYFVDGSTPPPVDPPGTNPHPDKWKDDHREQVSPSEAATCALCHQSNYDQPPNCFNNTLCHGGDGDEDSDESTPPPIDPPGTNPHPDKWKDDHREQVSPSEAATCALCHQSNYDQPPSCFNNTLCHGGDDDDVSGDSFAPPSFTIFAAECGPVDCNDGDRLVNPGAGENCNDGIDNDCNGLVDDADPICAQELTDFDITRFKSKRKAKIGKKLKIHLQVKNRGPKSTSTAINVYGMMGQTYIPVATELRVQAGRRKGNSKHSFYYYPDTAGEIIWHAEITDGDPDVDHKTFKTIVKGRRR